jgi:hypothetical protein
MGFTLDKPLLIAKSRGSASSSGYFFASLISTPLLRKDSGLAYIGEWLKDQMAGEAFLSIPGEGVCHGQFQEGLLHGALLFVSHSNWSIVHYDQGDRHGDGLERDGSGLWLMSFEAGRLVRRDPCPDLLLF